MKEKISIFIFFFLNSYLSTSIPKKTRNNCLITYQRQNITVGEKQKSVRVRPWEIYSCLSPTELHIVDSSDTMDIGYLQTDLWRLEMYLERTGFLSTAKRAFNSVLPFVIHRLTIDSMLLSTPQPKQKLQTHKCNVNSKYTRCNSRISEIGYKVALAVRYQISYHGRLYILFNSNIFNFSLDNQLIKRFWKNLVFILLWVTRKPAEYGM